MNKEGITFADLQNAHNYITQSNKKSWGRVVRISKEKFIKELLDKLHDIEYPSPKNVDLESYHSGYYDCQQRIKQILTNYINK